MAKEERMKVTLHTANKPARSLSDIDCSHGCERKTKKLILQVALGGREKPALQRNPPNLANEIYFDNQGAATSKF